MAYASGGRKSPWSRLLNAAVYFGIVALCGSDLRLILISYTAFLGGMLELAYLANGR